MNEPHCHKNSCHRFYKTNWKLTKKIGFQETFTSSKQMFSIDKMSPMLLKMSLPQIFTVYDIQAVRKLPEDFPENILGRVILVYNRYSEQSVCNLIKTRTLQPVFLEKCLKMDNSTRLVLNSPR